MTTSKSHAVLFTKDKCKPCIETKLFIGDVFDQYPELTDTLSILKKENHSALVEAYDLELYPTLLIVGPNGTELDRVVGGAAIRGCIEDKLIEIYKENNA